VLNRELDIVKYNNCIAKAVNSRIYAFSWYLNCVTDNWDALVLNNYEAVMPLPKRKKLGLNYIYLPPWSQQLGVFSERKIDNEQIRMFLKAIPKKFILVDYFLNSGNRIENKYTIKKDNYILSLNADFETIKKAYNKNRKRISNKNYSDLEVKKRGNRDSFLSFYKTQEMDFKTHKDTFEKLETLLKTENKAVNIWTVSRKGKLIAGLVWLKDKHRITYLAPVANKEAKDRNATTYLINELIKTHQNTNLILDFEGSMVEGVARFYKSFGTKKETYYWYKKKIIGWIVKQ